jgi:hypothetical protein
MWPQIENVRRFFCTKAQAGCQEDEVFYFIILPILAKALMDISCLLPPPDDMMCRSLLSLLLKVDFLTGIVSPN